MKNWINGFGTCFAMFTAIGFGLAVWWTYPHKIQTSSSNAKMDMMVMAYNGEDFDYTPSAADDNLVLLTTEDLQ